MKIRNLNRMYYGFISGLIIPVLFMLIILFVRKDEKTLIDFFDAFYQTGILPKLISICLIPNLLLFFIFIWTNHYKAARGVILSMFFAGLVIGLLKIF